MVVTLHPSGVRRFIAGMWYSQFEAVDTEGNGYAVYAALTVQADEAFTLSPAAQACPFDPDYVEREEGAFAS